MSALSTAFLPGIGRIADPQPEDYLKAILYLRRGGRWPTERSVCWRLMATERRLQWTPRRLRQMREAAA